MTWKNVKEGAGRRPLRTTANLQHTQEQSEGTTSSRAGKGAEVLQARRPPQSTEMCRYMSWAMLCPVVLNNNN
jgi:hypothetical protein